jgi:hypothetical protein
MASVLMAHPAFCAAAAGSRPRYSFLKFTDGTPLDAQAVKENIDRSQTQQKSAVASELAVISKVVVNGRHGIERWAGVRNHSGTREP